MFIDHVIVEAVAGRGGDGCVAFRREKYVPRGGPSGGDGGRGGDVIVEATHRVGTLIDLQYRRTYKADNGGHGEGNSRRGKNGEDVRIPVPPGTTITDKSDGTLLGELLNEGDTLVVAKGGKGGFGNERFKSPRNRAPRKATPGADGERRALEITLKLIADVGLVGEPNAGKSTLLGALSAAHPKVASYPFTTRTPVLGIVRSGEFESFVMVDIPGLIEGAHRGRGMGKAFLRHIERCRILVYLLDVSQGDPAGSYHALRHEMLHYDPVLLEKPSIVALTKCDLLEGGTAGVDPDWLEVHPHVFPISSLSKQGLKELVGELRRRLSKL